ncbi:unnamed protein product [Brassica rapa subsp. narinosa]
MRSSMLGLHRRGGVFSDSTPRSSLKDNGIRKTELLTRILEVNSELNPTR